MQIKTLSSLPLLVASVSALAIRDTADTEREHNNAVQLAHNTTDTEREHNDLVQLIHKTTGTNREYDLPRHIPNTTDIGQVHKADRIICYRTGEQWDTKDGSTREGALQAVVMACRDVFVGHYPPDKPFAAACYHIGENKHINFTMDKLWGYRKWDLWVNFDECVSSLRQGIIHCSRGGHRFHQPLLWTSDPNKGDWCEPRT
ncbi:hypothetical protein F4808DRAFT_468315 [Astrocystis sublimbata]|nr:hypothetical protein F4808DRAFT_468315 [Astrocystis sublimbata]